MHPSRRRGLYGATLAAGACLATLVTAATANASGARMGARESGPQTTLSIQVQTGQNPLIDCYIKLFKSENPGVSVTTSEVATLAKNGTNLEVVTSSNPPDVGIIPTNSPVYSRMIAAHELTPLSSVWKIDNLQRAYGQNASLQESRGVPQVVSIDDSYYALIYYNEAIFKKLGIAPPANHRFASLGQLINDAQKVEKAGYDGIALPGESGYEASWMIDAFMNTSTLPAQYANFNTSWQSGSSIDVSYTSPQFVKALSAIMELGKANVFEPGYLGVTQAPEAEALFLDKKAAMLVDGSWEAIDVKGFPYSWALLPPVPGSHAQNKMTEYAGDTYGIPIGAKNKAMAMKFLELIETPKGQGCNLQTGALPGINTMPAADFSRLPLADQQMLAFAKKYGAQVGWTSGVPGNIGQTFTDPLVQAMLGGKLTPLEVAEKVKANFVKSRS